jgi:3D (Asp-Asp-Asp) domain-containing protein
MLPVRQCGVRAFVALPLGLGLLVTACADGSSRTSATAPPPTPAPHSASAPAPAAVVAGKPLGRFTVTCHTGAGRTASGRRDGPGMAAVDGDVVPLGSALQVEKLGRVTAADRGGAVDGRSLDVWMPTTAACTRFGRQQLQVWRVGG